VPVVALFGPTHPALGFSPLGEHAIIITKEHDCSPCSLHGESPCPRDRVYCMEEIGVDEVQQAVQAFVGKDTR
jgi:heptosyltransferase-2